MTMNALMMCFYNFFIFILERALLIFTKMRYIYWYFPRNLNVPVYQCFTLSTLKNLNVWWTLQYLALWATIRN